VASGTQPDSAVYFQTNQISPAEVTAAGGLSPYGTMGQGGNVWEWTETALSGDNNSATNVRTIRGGGWTSPEGQLSSSFRSSNGFPDGERTWVGFRVASVPEPSTYALLLATGVLWWVARKARFGRAVRRKIPH
jgi:formylglycine-generating enzyme required for sulfatase activity